MDRVSVVIAAANGFLGRHVARCFAREKRKDDVKDRYVGNKNWSHVDTQPVRANDKCWRGFNVTVLKGVQIGEGAVVGSWFCCHQRCPCMDDCGWKSCKSDSGDSC
jgi:acetyltransferase-like isoleucine patch superfamily enzyme